MDRRRRCRRESLISRSGKTWKRLGDIAELAQYFLIADEARAKRAVEPSDLDDDGVGQGPQPIAAGGTPPRRR